MTPDVLAERLEAAYAELDGKLAGAFTAAEAVTQAGLTLATEKAKILVDYQADPKALGVNEATRAAKVDDMTAGLVNAKYAAEVVDRKWRHDVERARLRVDGLRAQLRVAEVAAGLSRGRD